MGALDKPTEGQVFFDGQEITALSEHEREQIRRTKMGFVFQSVSLIPMLNAYENVEFALRLAGIKENREERVKECLRMVGLEKRMNHMPQELSGGEQQRVAIARAIVHKPQILFADEPTAELDSHTSKIVAGLFRELVEKEGITVLMTTHDSSLMNVGSHLIELADGEVVG
jgi:putative ABC transport system ATP-binding protein